MGGCLNKGCVNKTSKPILAEKSHRNDQSPILSGGSDKDSTDACPTGLNVIHPIIVPERETRILNCRKSDVPSKESVHHLTVQFPFVVDQKCINFIKQSKTMFIMRGVPGSGKSTIVRDLVKKYPDAVVCSADHYMHSENDNEYKFDANNLREVHEKCQQKAQSSCEIYCPVIVIDNTNIRRWEMKKYLELARSYNYIVIMVVPRTDWKMDPNECARRNVHDVPAEIIQRKINDFEDAVPIYYAWFLNENSSAHLLSLKRKYLLECVSNVPELKEIICQNFSHEDSLEEKLEEIYPTVRPDSTRISTCAHHVLHCTAKFLGSRRNCMPGVEAYCQSEILQKAVGNVWPLMIIGLSITPTTIGARVHLNDEVMWHLFDSQEEKDFDNNFQTQNLSINIDKENPVPSRNADQVFNKQFSWPAYFENVSQNYPRKGRTAHITLGFKHQPKDTVQDILHVCHKEYILTKEHREIEAFEVDGGRIHHYGDGVCALYLHKPFEVDALFTGFY
ncbi:hypothetical protein ScPMuIL_016850 [Solemya velum]